MAHLEWLFVDFGPEALEAAEARQFLNYVSASAVLAAL